MQFKHPEILYALLALLIPIFIHLFQLQRFTKTPFTNVKFLKEIKLQTRKSSRLKKWLILFARLLAFAAIIIAFAQPYFSNTDTSKDWFTTIYLDNSISMQAKGEHGELMKRAIQDIAENIPDKGNFALLTNTEMHSDLSRDLLVEQLKNTDYSSSKLDINTILFKHQQVTNKHKNQYHKLLLFSDFQNTESKFDTTHVKFDYVKLVPKKDFNISIDSVFIAETNSDNKQIEIILKNQGKKTKNISVSVLQNQVLLAKSTLDFSSNKTQNLKLRIPIDATNISIKIDYNDCCLFDNTYYISFQKKEKIAVLLISDEVSFLERIYTDDEFNLTKNKPNQVAFNLIDKQQLIILENLKTIPQSLLTKLPEFVNSGGSLVIIPNRNNTIDQLNQLMNQLGIGQLFNIKSDSLQVTKIHFEHPILKNVFDKRVHNFQYPKVTTSFKGQFFNEQPILSFENQKAFITQINRKKGKVFWIASALDKKSSNFTNAPLIVPIFYNMGKLSVKHPQLSYRIGTENQISIVTKLDKDAILHIIGKQTNFIPIQQINTDNVLLQTNDIPSKSGFYTVKNNKNSIHNLAFNYSKAESNISYIDLKDFSENNKNIHSFSSVKDALSALSNQQNIQSYFKWFVLLALLFLFIEILLIKYL